MKNPSLLETACGSPKKTLWDGNVFNKANNINGIHVDYARRCGLVNMNPRNDLASTGFCLANPGVEYIVYEPGGSPFSVSGLPEHCAVY
jgi:hypothetical protein